MLGLGFEKRKTVSDFSFFFFPFGVRCVADLDYNGRACDETNAMQGYLDKFSGGLGSQISSIWFLNRKNR